MKLSLRIKILVPLFLVLLVVFTGFFSYSTITYRGIIIANMEDKVQSSLSELVRQVVANQASVYSLKRGLDKNILRIVKAVREAVEQPGFDRSEANMIRMAQEIGVAEIHLVDRDGILRWGNIAGFYGFDFASSEQTRPFLAALNDSSFELAQDPQPRGADNVLFQYFGVAGRGDLGLVQVGVEPLELQVALQATDLESLVASYKVDNYDGFSYILDNEGTILNHPDKQMLGKSIRDMDFGESFLTGMEKKGLFHYQMDGRKILMAYERYGEKIYTANVFEQPYMEPFTHLFGILLITFFVSLALIITMMILVVNRLAVKPITVVKNNMLEISRGEGDLTRNLRAVSRDEIGDLARGFNQFLEKLREIIHNLKKSSGLMSNARSTLSATAEETAASVTQISANINGVKKQIEVLDKNISGTSDEVNQFQLIIQSLKNEISEQSSAVEQSTAAVHQMVASLKNVAGITQTKKGATDVLVQTTRLGGEKMTSTARVVEDIHSSIDTISDMVSVINGIASQTNLLSMNAAIEAAHAGDAGKGFAVVADEIRKLAETSGENAKGIGKELKDIVQKIQAAADSSQSTSKAFDEILTEVMDVSEALDEINSSTLELSRGGEQILDAMQMLNSVSANVQGGSDKMSGGIITMSQAMQAVIRISSEVLGSMEEIAAGNQEIAQAMDQLTNLTVTLDEASSGLESEIGRFRIE